MLLSVVEARNLQWATTSLNMASNNEAVKEGCRFLYSLRIREEAFSETQRHKKRAEASTPR
jgi:hypothetical protein